MTVQIRMEDIDGWCDPETGVCRIPPREAASGAAAEDEPASSTEAAKSRRD